MKAAVIAAPEQPYEILDIDLASPGEREVLVRIAAAGVCHSDLSVQKGRVPSPMPAVLGHEGAGVVEAVGPGVTSLQEGDAVVLSFVPSCGSCRFCTIGRSSLCDRAARLGGNLFDGSSRLSRSGETINHFLGTSCFAERTVVPESGAVKVPQGLPLQELCLVGCCVTTGFGAVFNRARVQFGSTVAVFGCGGVGLNIIQASAMAGASRIVAVDLVEGRLARARELGATDTVNASEEDGVAGVRRVAGRQGVDYAFEAVGRPETIASAFAAAARGGTAVVVGMAPADSTVQIPGRYFIQEKALIGSMYGSGNPRDEIARLVSLYQQGSLKLSPLVSRQWRLEEINDAFAALERGEGARGVIVF